MKSALKFSVLIFCVLSLSNCDKENTICLDSEINVTMNNSEAYELDLLISGDEEGASIITQAQHFQKSELIRDSTTNWSVVYYYEPLPNFTGIDFIEIEKSSLFTPNSNNEIVRINFEVIN